MQKNAKAYGTVRTSEPGMGLYYLFALVFLESEGPVMNQVVFCSQKMALKSYPGARSQNATFRVIPQLLHNSLVAYPLVAHSIGPPTPFLPKTNEVKGKCIIICSPSILSTFRREQVAPSPALHASVTPVLYKYLRVVDNGFEYMK